MSLTQISTYRVQLTEILGTVSYHECHMFCLGLDCTVSYCITGYFNTNIVFNDIRSLSISPRGGGCCARLSHVKRTVHQVCCSPQSVGIQLCAGGTLAGRVRLEP